MKSINLYWPQRDRGRFESLIEYYKNNCFKNEELKYIKLNDAVVLPFVKICDLSTIGSVADNNNNNIIQGCSRVENFIPKEIYSRDGSEDIELHKSIYLGHFLNQVGHFILESMAKWWLILDDNFSDYKLVYTVSEWGFADWMNEFLDIFGIKNAQLITKPTVFRELIVPDSSSGISPDFYTCEYINTINKIKFSVEPSGYDKIYFSRMKLKDNLIGEYELQETFTRNNFKVFYPEKMDIRQKISVMRSCKEFAAISGTTPLWVLFGDNIQKTYIFHELYHNLILMNRNKPL